MCFRTCAQESGQKVETGIRVEAPLGRATCELPSAEKSCPGSCVTSPRGDLPVQMS